MCGAEAKKFIGKLSKDEAPREPGLLQKAISESQLTKGKKVR